MGGDKSHLRAAAVAKVEKFNAWWQSMAAAVVEWCEPTLPMFTAAATEMGTRDAVGEDCC